jgi:oligoribonuclease
VLGIFLDTETNGLDPKTHKVLELAFKIVDLSSGALKEEYQTILTHSAQDWAKSDPESLKINGFHWDEIQKGKTLHDASQEIIRCFKKWNIQRKKGVFICQNPSFDRAFFSQIIDANIQEEMNWPYHWLDLASMHWAILLDKAKMKQGRFPWEVGLSKDSIATYYGLPAEEKPHRAMNGVSHLLLCYGAVVGFPQVCKI